MTTEDLLKSLDIAPEPTRGDPGAFPDEITPDVQPAADRSPTALRMDKWSRRRGAESLEGGREAEELREVSDRIWPVGEIGIDEAPIGELMSL